MRNHAEWRRLSLALAGVAALAVLVIAGMPTAAAWAQATTTQPPAVPQWQIDAGGKIAFEVASVKQNVAAPSGTTVHSNIYLGLGDAYTPTGGLFSAADVPLFQYMVFAYKLTPDQTKSVISQMSKWANERFDIEARASGNPTKDQFRLMMQALLADRFKLAVHYETKQIPVLALVLDKPGKLGPQIRLHPKDSPCSTASSPGPPNAAPGPTTVVGGFPELCGAVIGWPSTNPPGRIRLGARNVPIAMFTSQVNVAVTGIDRPILDKTGLNGNCDFIMEFTPEVVEQDAPPDFQPDATGPKFMEALKEQLGLKLEPQTGLVDVLVIDHVEEPSPN
jgi:uncharacterized protein (TIGR03435 family)